MYPRTSIITVVLNDPEGLLATGRSIIRQSSSNYEWIIVDGGSDDDTLSVIKQINLINPVIFSAKDNGIYDAMNKGIELASFEHLIFMNAGDTFSDESVLYDIERFLSRNPGLDVVLGGTYRNVNKCVFYSPPKDIRWIDHGLPAFHQSTIYKKELMQRRKYNINYLLLADYEWLAFHCVSGISVGYLNRPISNYFVGGSSYTKIRVKFNDLLSVKRDVLGCSLLYSVITSVTAIFRTLFVMKIIYRLCFLYDHGSRCREGVNADIASCNMESEYFRYQTKQAIT